MINNHFSADERKIFTLKILIKNTLSNIDFADVSLANNRSNNFYFFSLQGQLSQQGEEANPDLVPLAKSMDDLADYYTDPNNLNRRYPILKEEILSDSIAYFLIASYQRPSVLQEWLTTQPSLAEKVADLNAKFSILFAKNPEKYHELMHLIVYSFSNKPEADPYKTRLKDFFLLKENHEIGILLGENISELKLIGKAWYEYAKAQAEQQKLAELGIDEIALSIQQKEKAKAANKDIRAWKTENIMKSLTSNADGAEQAFDLFNKDSVLKKAEEAVFNSLNIDNDNLYAGTKVIEYEKLKKAENKNTHRSEATNLDNKLQIALEHPLLNPKQLVAANNLIALLSTWNANGKEQEFDVFFSELAKKVFAFMPQHQKNNSVNGADDLMANLYPALEGVNLTQAHLDKLEAIYEALQTNSIPIRDLSDDEFANLTADERSHRTNQGRLYTITTLLAPIDNILKRKQNLKSEIETLRENLKECLRLINTELIELKKINLIKKDSFIDKKITTLEELRSNLQQSFNQAFNFSVDENAIKNASDFLTTTKQQIQQSLTTASSEIEAKNNQLLSTNSLYSFIKKLCAIFKIAIFKDKTQSLLNAQAAFFANSPDKKTTQTVADDPKPVPALGASH